MSSSINVQVNRNNNIISVGINSTGPQGQSAYETWLSLGNTGTKQDFINSQFDEPARVLNENARRQNETTRIENENVRIEAENIRQQQENLRQQEFETNELTRQNNETTRISNEEARQEADILRGQTVEAIEQHYAPRLTSVEGRINSLDAQLKLEKFNKYETTFYDFPNINELTFKNADNGTGDTTIWTIADEKITSVVTLNVTGSVCWLPKTLQDGKLSMIWENPNMETQGQGYLGFAIKGDGVNNFIGVAILHGPSKNQCGIYKFVNGVLASELKRQTITTADSMAITGTPTQIECEFYGKFLTVKINGKKIIDNYTNSEFLQNSKCRIGLLSSKVSNGMIFSNFAIAEKKYDIIPNNISKILCVGDSITYGSGASNRSVTSWVSRLRTKLQEYNPNIVVDNVGIAGNMIGEVLNNQVIPNLTNGYEIVIVQCGTNDGRIDRTVTFNDSIANMTSIIKQLKSNNIIPIICTPTPYTPNIATYIPTSYDNNSYWYNVKLVGLIRKVAAKEKVRIVDNYSLFNNDLTLLTSSDQLHPNDNGHNLIYQNVYNVLTNKY